MPATVLAAALARAGFRLYTPFLNAASLESVHALHDLRPDHVIFVGGSADDARTVARLLPGQRIYRWSPDPSTSPDQYPAILPASLTAVEAFFSARSLIPIASPHLSGHTLNSRARTGHERK